MWDGLSALTMPWAGLGLTWLIQSTVLLALGLLAGQLLRRSGPAVLSGIYRTTLAAILICPVASAGLMGAGFDGLSLRLQSAADGPATGRNPPAVARPVVAAREPAPRDVAPDRGESSLRLAATTRTEPPRRAVTRRAATVPAPTPSLRLTLARVVAVGFAVWGFGATVVGLRLGVGLIRMRRLRAAAVPAEPDVEALCREIARRLDVEAPSVWRSPFLFSPCLDGLRRPAILLPDDIDEDLGDILVHEIAHLVRRDGLWNLLRRSAAVLLWIQPLFWVLTRRLEAAAEEVCDDYVVQFGADRARYAGRLLELAGRALPPAAPAGVGMVSLRSMLARRIVRILDTSRTLSTRAGTRAVLVMLVAGLVGTVFAGLLGVGGGERKAKAQGPKPATEARSRPEDETIRGRVVDPTGTPVAGATVIAARWRQIRDDGIEPGPDSDGPYKEVRKIADQAGRFEFSFDRPQPDPENPEVWGDAHVLATAPGFGLGFLLKGQPIRLSAGDLPIVGRLVDLEGRPMPGIHVRLGQVYILAPGIVEGTPSQSKPWSLEGRIGLDATPLLPDGVVTDADGRFRIEGLGLDALANLSLSGTAIASKYVKVVTRMIDPVADGSRHEDSVTLDDPLIYGARCTIAVEPTRPIEGFVRDAETKEPIPGAVVTAATLSGSAWMLDRRVSTESDAQGHYRLVGLPKERGKGHKLAVYPPLDLPYFVTSGIEVRARPGIDAVTRDIALKRGTWVTGKVTDIKTSQPVNAVVDYFPFLTNTHAKDYPNFDPETTASVALKARYRTDRDGRFRVVVLPGRGVVTARVDRGPYRTGFGAESIGGQTKENQLPTYDHIFTTLYHGLREVNVPAGADSSTCDVPLDPGGTRRLRLVDPSGTSVDNARVIGRLPDSVDLDGGERKESVITISGLEAGKPRTVVIRHAARKLGAILTVPTEGSADGDELAVTLRPNATVTGRLVDKKAKPFTGHVQVRLIPSVVSLHDEILIEDVTVDADGRFRCDELSPGGPYHLWVVNKEGSYARVQRKPEEFSPFELSGNLKVEPGQVVDFGTIDVDTREPVEPPPAKPAHADVPINGRIVDLEGRPVAGVSVKVGDVRGSKSDDLTAWIGAVGNGEAPWIAYRHINDDVKLAESVRREATTDADGRFQFQGLGGERVAQLTIQGDAVAYTRIDVVTRKIEPFPARGFPDTHGPGAQTVYGAEFTLTASPGRPVEGVVRDAKTKRPLPGVSVESWRFAGSNFVDTRRLKSVTDERGRFRIVGMPKGTGNAIIAIPNDDQPYLMREAPVGDPPGIAPVAVEIELHRGVMITGKITDKATGQPVAEARLHYLPFLENRYAQALPEFGKNGHVDGFQSRYTTKADGTYRLVGMPGRAIVGVESVGKTPYRKGVGSETIAGLGKNGMYKTWYNPIWPGRGWPNTLVEINPAEGAETLDLDAQLDPGLSLRIKVVDAEGKPVPDASVEGGKRLRIAEGTPDALFELASFRPDEVRSVVIRDNGRKLGKVVRLRAGDDGTGPVAITLAPMATIKGRVVDADGNPVSAATVRVDVKPTDFFLHTLTNLAADRDGRFEVSNVPDGCEYGLVVESGTMNKQRRVGFGEATVKPGETTDVGNITLKGD